MQSTEEIMVIDDDAQESEESEDVGVNEDDSEMMTETEVHRGTRGFLVGLILGTVVGVSIALLFAPEPGEKARRRLGKRVRRLHKQAGKETSELAKRARKRLARARR